MTKKDVIKKKACSEKSRPLLTYEKHHFKDM